MHKQTELPTHVTQTGISPFAQRNRGAVKVFAKWTKKPKIAVTNLGIRYDASPERKLLAV
jgi:hypothetical protein